MRGRKPKPTELHKRHGTTNVTRHKARLEHEPVPVTEIGTAAPDWMSEEQKVGWRYALEHSPPGLLKAIDAGILAIWVEAEDRWRRAIIFQAKFDEGAEFPMLAMTEQGNLVQSLYLGIINRAAQLMIKCAGELGFSPAARPRLATTGMVIDAAPLGAPAPPSNSLDSYLAHRPVDIN